MIRYSKKQNRKFAKRVTKKNRKKTKKNIHHTGGGRPKPKSKGSTKKKPTKSPNSTKSSNSTKPNNIFTKLNSNIKKAKSPDEIKKLKARKLEELEKFSPKQLKDLGLESQLKELTQEKGSEKAKDNLKKLINLKAAEGAKQGQITNDEAKQGPTSLKLPIKLPISNGPPVKGSPRVANARNTRTSNSNKTKKNQPKRRGFFEKLRNAAFPSLKSSWPKFKEELVKLREEERLLERKGNKTDTESVNRAIKSKEQQIDLKRTEMKGYLYTTLEKDLQVLNKRVKDLDKLKGQQREKAIEDISETIKNQKLVINKLVENLGTEGAKLKQEIFENYDDLEKSIKPNVNLSSNRLNESTNA